ncbi:MAG: ATP-binding cassette domain-containing protein [Alphaproteobacteria bacterium]|nr:ATP-binding cassette domain-containing protein [Alphaproteobacteria bacterium]
MAEPEKKEKSTWLKAAIAPLRRDFRTVFGASAIINLLAIAAPVFVLQVYDRVIFHAGMATLYGLIVGMGVVILFDFLLRQARARLLQDVALRIDVSVGRRLFKKLLALPLGVLESRPRAYWLALQRDVDSVRNLFSGATAVLVADLPFALFFATIIIVIAPPIAWVLLIMLPAFVGVGWLSARNVTKAGARERAAGIDRDATLSEMAGAWDTVKGLALDKAIEGEWEARHATTLEQSIHRGSRADTFLNLSLMLGVAATVLITSVGAIAILEQKMTIGALIAANMLAMRLVSPFQQITMLWRNYASTRQAMARLDEVFALEEERGETAIHLERPNGKLSLNGVAFSYEEDAPPLIRDMRLNIEPNGLYGLVGVNGSGKTTLMKILLGLYGPSDGSVQIDGIDIAQIGREDRAKWYGYLPQDCRLFTGTVRENIVRGRENIVDQNVIDAAKRAGVHDTIIALPDGYGTHVAEAGGNFSAGTCQRIALARAIVHDPVILLLDEPSAHLDHNGERELSEMLAVLAADHTIVVATHSPALLSACHSLLVIEAGRAKWAGTPKDILPRLFSSIEAEPGAEGNK